MTQAKHLTEGLRYLAVRQRLTEVWLITNLGTQQQEVPRVVFSRPSRCSSCSDAGRRR
jgi:hypothetical protein